jgi:hypothetical protein
MQCVVSKHNFVIHCSFYSTGKLFLQNRRLVFVIIVILSNLRVICVGYVVIEFALNCLFAVLQKRSRQRHDVDAAREDGACNASVAQVGVVSGCDCAQGRIIVGTQGKRPHQIAKFRDAEKKLQRGSLGGGRTKKFQISALFL